MRAITFQSIGVVNLLMSGIAYVPDINKCREHSSYIDDGGPKVWLFGLENNEYSNINDGKLFQRCMNEMSIDIDLFVQLYMIELEIDEKLVSVGLTHNFCSFAFVTPKLSIDNVVSIFKLESTRMWFCVNAKRIYKNNNLESIYSDYIDTFNYKVKRNGLFTEYSHDGCTVGEVTSCKFCEVETSYYVNEIPVCSRECVHYMNLWESGDIPEYIISMLSKDFNLSREQSIKKIMDRPKWIRFYY